MTYPGIFNRKDWVYCTHETGKRTSTKWPPLQVRERERERVFVYVRNCIGKARERERLPGRVQFSIYILRETEYIITKYNNYIQP